MTQNGFGEGNGNPLQYSCLENPMDQGAWHATVCEVTRVRHDLATKLLTRMVYWKKSLVGCHLWGRTELDTTETTQQQQQQQHLATSEMLGKET